LFRKVVREAGCAIIGQTEELAPADRRFYAIRDVTSTVESVPLITASILAKKIAAGLDALVMDVKVGSGAFMSSMDQARELASSIISTAAAAGLKAHALITDMNECLGTTAGNALEIAESIRILANDQRDSRLNEIVMALCAEMLLASGLEGDRDAALAKADEAVTSGRAAEKFERMVTGLGGPPDFVTTHEKHLPTAPVTLAVHAKSHGYLAAVDAFRLGNAIIELGGGRRKLGDSLDLAVGLSSVANIGDTVDGDRPLLVIHANSKNSAEAASELVRNACTVTDETPASRPAVYETLTAD